MNKLDCRQQQLNRPKGPGVKERREELAGELKALALEPELPEDLWPWLHRQGFATGHYMFYRSKWLMNYLEERKQRALVGHCTACGGDMELALMMASPHPDSFEYVDHGRVIYCPECGEAVECRGWAKSKNGIEESCHVLYFARHEDKVIGCGIEALHSWDREGRERRGTEYTDLYLFGWEWPIWLAKWSGGYRSGGRYTTSRFFYKERMEDGPWRYIYPPDWELFDGTALQNSHVWNYISRGGGKHEYSLRPMQYCNVFLKHPGIENLLMQGFDRLVATKLQGDRTINSTVKWREASPRKMLELNKDEQARCRKEEWSAAQLQRYKEARAEGWLMDKGDLAIWSVERSTFTCHEPELAGRDALYYRYLKRQHRKHKYSYNTLCREMQDYIQAGRALGYDFTDEGILFPPNLHAAHDRAVAARQYAVDEKKRTQFAEMAHKLAPLAFEDGEYCIFAAPDEQALIFEGRELSHCVGGYGQSHCDGRSIFFLRRTQTPEVPYFTLQLDVEKKKILQNRGKKNCPPPEAVKAFAETWLAGVVARYDHKSGKLKKQIRGKVYSGG